MMRKVVVDDRQTTPITWNLNFADNGCAANYCSVIWVKFWQIFGWKSVIGRDWDYCKGSILLTRISQYFRIFLFTFHVSGRHLIGSRKIVLKAVFAKWKNFRMFFCFGFAAPAAYRALCQSCLPHSSYKTTRSCKQLEIAHLHPLVQPLDKKELESLKGTNCCIAILALDQEFIWWLGTLSERLQFDLEGFPGGHRTPS